MNKSTEMFQMDYRRKIAYGSAIYGKVPTYELVMFFKVHLITRNNNSTTEVEGKSSSLISG